MKITITTPAEIEEFLAAQCKLLREDRLPISVLLKPADDSCWRDGKQVSDAHGEAFGPLFLGAMLSRASLKLRAEDRYPADSELEVSFGLSLFADNESIMVYPSCIEQIVYTQERVRVITDPPPADLRVRGLQYSLECITGDDGARGFKAGCNKVTGKRAVEVLAWLAKSLGYTIKLKPQRRIKPAKT
jgi:hypothetical protein